MLSAAVLAERVEERVPKVEERGFKVPFDIKTEPDLKSRDSNVTPAGLFPHQRETPPPFVGIGIRRPLQSDSAK